MNVVKKYEVEDGTLFDNIEEARNYERELKLRKKLTAIMLPAFNSGRAEAVILSMASNAREVRDTLTAFLRTMPADAENNSDYDSK